MSLGQHSRCNRSVLLADGRLRHGLRRTGERVSKRLGHATAQVTMSTYADEIEEAADNTIRMKRVEAMFASTRMAALLSVGQSDGGGQQTEPDGEVVCLAEARFAG